MPDIKSERPGETRDFFVELLGFEVAMDLGWIVTVASPTNPAVQVSIIGNHDVAAPGISVGVADVDAVHARGVERGFEIVYPIRDEAWRVRRWKSAVREPCRAGERAAPRLLLRAAPRFKRRVPGESSWLGTRGVRLQDAGATPCRSSGASAQRERSTPS